jgi:hypothetical protein
MVSSYNFQVVLSIVILNATLAGKASYAAFENLRKANGPSIWTARP